MRVDVMSKMRGLDLHLTDLRRLARFIGKVTPLGEELLSIGEAFPNRMIFQALSPCSLSFSPH